jgi:hypothetical protein
MYLEDCPVTREENDFYFKKIIKHFPELAANTDKKILSLKEYIYKRPQKFYNKKVYSEYFEFLKDYLTTNPHSFIKIFKEVGSELNIAMKSLNTINDENYHDHIGPEGEIETIRYIEDNIHFNYLRLIEGIYYQLILLIAYKSRLNRGKSVEGLDVYNCAEEIKHTQFSYLSDYYNNIIRNGIAHGGVIFRNKNTAYKGKKGNTHEIRTDEIISLHDNLLDISNGMNLAFRVFTILNRDFFEKNNLAIPRQLFIQELIAQTNAPNWNVIDCLENELPDGRKQLNVITENKLFSLTEVNYFAFRTAILAEYFAPGYDKYLLYLGSKINLPGWAGFDGSILKNGRLKNSSDLNDYNGVYKEGDLFFIPKYKIPNGIRKILNYLTLLKNNFKLMFHPERGNIFIRKFKLRFTNPFRRGVSIIINNAKVYIYPEFKDQIQNIIRTRHKRIVKHVIKKSRNKLLYRLLRVSYIRIVIYDEDLRRRKFINSGLCNDLVCTITLNRSKKIKRTDIFSGIKEDRGKYQIVWNSNWKDIDTIKTA